MCKRLLAILLCLSLLLCGCGYDSGEEGYYVSVYRMRNAGDSGGALLVKETVSYSADEDALDVMLRALNSEPEILGFSRVFPEGVEILSCTVERGMARVSMSEEYAQLDKLQQLICSGAVVLTLSALDSVCSVNIQCGGMLLARALRAEDFIHADSLFEAHERNAKLFLPTQDGEGLYPCSRMLKTEQGSSMEELIANAVLSELPVYTEKTVVLSAETENGICSLDLSEAFYGNEPADDTEGMLIIYALVNSLCRLNNVRGVVISVEGQAVVSYGGFRAAWPLTASDKLIIYS